jgi:hypothetical protein
MSDGSRGSRVEGRGSGEEIARTFLARLFAEHGPAPDIDWEKFRLMQLIPGTAGVSDPMKRDALVERGFIELGRGKFDANIERRSLDSLRALITQVLGTRPVILSGFSNPLVDAMSNSPAPTTPPNLMRLLGAVGEIVRQADAVTFGAPGDKLGERLMTLLFVDGRYVGFLPASRTITSTGATA